ncbi:MAG TPA: hypothetical protein VHY76_07720 [Acetobacteraceae bacterium]|nr:hypothetical protein [Acetobacteraceae bacterium]
MRRPILTSLTAVMIAAGVFAAPALSSSVNEPGSRGPVIQTSAPAATSVPGAILVNV